MSQLYDVNNSRCDTLETSGRWIRCSTLPVSAAHHCLRWGWTFRPNSGCYYEDWKPRELAAFGSSTLPLDETEGQFQASKWIVILGSSKIRGIFFSAVDMLLDGKPADVLSIGKCWGRIDVTLGTLRLTFQDFRAPAVLPWPLPTPDNDMLECHGEHVASYHAEYALNSTRFVKKLFQDPTHLPAAIVFEGERRQDPNT